MPNRYFKKADRKNQVEAALAIKAQQGSAPEATAYAIAKLLDMAVSPNLYSILADMVAEHRLNVRDEELGERCIRTFYILPEHRLPQWAKITREIRINGTLYQEELL